MASSSLPSSTADQILAALKALQVEQRALTSSVDAINGRVNALFGVHQVKQLAGQDGPENGAKLSAKLSADPQAHASQSSVAQRASPSLTAEERVESEHAVQAPASTKPSATSKIILTTYPGQSGIDPLVMNWGHKDPAVRGPVVVSRGSSTIRRRNAIGAHGGSYSTYHALAVASHEINVDHRPDFTNTEPAANIGPFPQWADAKKIVSMDPLGHLAPWLFKDTIAHEDVDIRPSIAITKAHMKLPELEQSVRSGRLVPDGKVCVNGTGELSVTKFAVEPVWYLPGVAERFGITEGDLRRSLFEQTGGSFPELITRSDIKVFLPPIGGLTVYCFGDPAKMSDPNVRLALRVHDECNGSDVFGWLSEAQSSALTGIGSDICTCRPYLIFGVEEAVKEAQSGGSGVVIYFRKEGRALGEVTKYLVYNARESLV